MMRSLVRIQAVAQRVRCFFLSFSRVEIKFCVNKFLRYTYRMTIEIIFWVLVFTVSLFSLVKGAGWLIAGAEKMGLSFGLSPFVIGVTIITLGTSLPELVSSLSAVFKGLPEYVSSTAIGSNISNILLVVGFAAVFGKKIAVEKDLIDIDLPLAVMVTVLFIGVAWDGGVNLIEAIILLSGYVLYIFYVLFHKDEKRIGRRVKILVEGDIPTRPKISYWDFVSIIGGAVALIFGANYLIDSVGVFATILGIPPGVIAISVVAIGTSLPELVVASRATIAGKGDIALGNIFGANIFNLLVVVGLPALVSFIPLGPQTFSIGLPMLAVAVFLFVIVGISKQIHLWEGSFFLFIYVVFIAKLFGLF